MSDDDNQKDHSDEDPNEGDSFLSAEATKSDISKRYVRDEDGTFRDVKDTVEQEKKTQSHRILPFSKGKGMEKLEEPGRIVCSSSGQVGLRYLISPNRFTKLAWLILVVLALFLTVIQVWQQLAQFADHPYSTNIDMSYPDKLNFPAVAICNTNQFRLSYQNDEVYKLDAELREQKRLGLYPKSTDLFNYYLDTRGRNHSSRTVMIDAAHQKEDMILKCTWPSGRKCSAADFTQTITDYGVCYSLNTDSEKPFVVQASGSGSGLQMLLNIENYERIEEQCVTESRTHGLLLVLYNQTDFPSVRARAVSIPNGFNVNVAVRSLVRKRIETCQHYSDMEFFHPLLNHTQETCVFDQHIQSLFKLCRCLPYTAPNNSFGLAFMRAHRARYCTMQEHVNCVAPRLNRMITGAQCLDKCERKEFETSQMVTYLPDNIMPLEADITEELTEVTRRRRQTVRASIKPTILNDCTESSILDIRQWNGISRKYSNAMEAQWRFQQKYRKPTIKLLEALKIAKDRLDELMWVPLEHLFMPTLDRLKANVSCVAAIYDEHSEIVEEMEHERESFTKVEDLKILLGIDHDPEDIDRVEQTHAENEESIIGLEKPKAVVKETLADLWQPYSSETYVDNLAQNLTTYLDIFELVEMYLAGNITRNEWAMTMLDQPMDNFWNKQYPEHFYWPVSNELSKSLVAHITEIKDEANENLNQILNNATLLRIASIMKLSSADDESLAKMSAFLTDLQNCTFGELFETGNELMETFQDAVAALEDSYLDLLDIHKQFVNTFENKAKFITENFASVNIFFQNLAEEQLSQGYTYDGWSLLCDVGGTLGLFLGASILSVIEIGWLFIFGYLHEREEAKERKREARRLAAMAQLPPEELDLSTPELSDSEKEKQSKSDKSSKGEEGEEQEEEEKYYESDTIKEKSDESSDEKKSPKDSEDSRESEPESGQNAAMSKSDYDNFDDQVVYF